MKANNGGLAQKARNLPYIRGHNELAVRVESVFSTRRNKDYCIGQTCLIKEEINIKTQLKLGD